MRVRSQPDPEWFANVLSLNTNVYEGEDGMSFKDQLKSILRGEGDKVSHVRNFTLAGLLLIAFALGALLL